MIHADADKAFKFLDKENVGSIDNEMLRNYLSERDYDAELVDKIFAGIDAATDGVIDADELRSAFVKFPTLCKAIEVKPRSVWAAMDHRRGDDNGRRNDDGCWYNWRRHNRWRDHGRSNDGRSDYCRRNNWRSDDGRTDDCRRYDPWGDDDGRGDHDRLRHNSCGHRLSRGAATQAS